MKQLIKMAFLFATISLSAQTVNMTAKWQKRTFGNLSTVEFKDSLNKYDFGKLWTETENRYIYGIVGENFQRIKIKILKVTKHKTNQNIYYVTGKSLGRNNVSDFHGTITLKSIKVCKIMHWGVDEEYKNKGIKKQGLLTATYHFEENKAQTHSGLFEGILYTSFFIDKSGKLQYDKIEFNSDNFRNNQFIGTWADHKTKKKLICNWADYRVPNSGDLDNGVAEFSPVDKYLKFGWQTYRDAYLNNKQAQQEEEKQWWDISAGNSSCKGDSLFAEKAAIDMLRSFYTEYMTAISKMPGENEAKKIIEKYCTPECVRYASQLSEKKDVDAYIFAQDADLRLIKTLKFNQTDSAKHLFTVQYSDSLWKSSCIIHLRVVKVENAYKIARIISGETSSYK